MPICKKFSKKLDKCAKMGYNVYKTTMHIGITGYGGTRNVDTTDGGEFK